MARGVTSADERITRAQSDLHRTLLIVMDILVAATVAATHWLPVMVGQPVDGRVLVGYFLLMVMIVGVVLRWRFPAAAAASVALATLLGALLQVTIDPMLATAWAVYPLALRRGFRRGWLRLGLFLLVFLLAAAFGSRQLEPFVLSLLTAVAAVACSWTLGSAVGERASLAAEAARERAHVTAMEQRLDLAREVHDVVAHTLGTIGIEAEVAAHIRSESEEDLRDRMAEIAVNARQALAQVRTLVVALRSDDLDTAARTPSLGDLDRVFERARAAGLELEVDIRHVSALDDLQQLTVFRVVQEAITNAVRHAPASRCRVRVARSGRLLVLEVSNDDGPVLRTSAQPGHGIVGIRERVAAAGGWCLIGPSESGGFGVHVELPYFSADNAERAPSERDV